MKRRTIGLLAVDTSSPYQAAVADALTLACAERDVNLVIFSDVYLTREAGEDTCRLFAAQLAGPANIDALIVPSLGNLMPPAETAAFLRRYRPLPICTVSMQLEGFPNVQIDNDVGFERVVRHLVEVHQHRYFVYLSRPPEHVEGQVRRRAFARTLSEYGLTPRPDIVIPGDIAFDPDIIRRDLAKIGDVDAIVAVDDYVVPSLLLVLGELGLRVPEDIAVTGFDDSDVARGAQPPLTSVRQTFYTMLDSALSLVMDRLDGRTVSDEVLVPPELVLRRSCGCQYDQVSIHPRQFSSHAPPTAELTQALEQVLGDWHNVQGLRLKPGSWEPELLSAFQCDLNEGTREVVARLGNYLDENLKRGGDEHAWHSVINILHRRVMPVVRSSALLLPRAEALFQHLRMQVARAEASRAQRQSIKTDTMSRQQAIVADRLLRHLDAEYLFATLPELFRQLGEVTFWFSTYLDTQHPRLGARLSSAMVDGIAMTSLASTEPFAPDLLVPPDVRRGDERYTWVVNPIHDEERQLGLLVCSYFFGHGVTFDIMALQISAALHGAMLVKRIAEETEERERAEHARLQRELELAQRIQTSILPKNLSVAGLGLAAIMQTATEVGGDYYDVLPLEDGCFVGIGDVAGHGLNTGLVMMMLQSAVSTAVALQPNINPQAAFVAANRVLHENIRNRLQQDEHMTLCLLRYRSNGVITYAGAHEEMLIFRAQSGLVESVAITGIWAGIVADASSMTPENEMTLLPDDVLLLYTDGSTEAANKNRERFGCERLMDEFAFVGRKPVQEICDSLLRAVNDWLDVQEDDVTFVVARYLGATA